MKVQGSQDSDSGQQSPSCIVDAEQQLLPGECPAAWIRVLVS